ncbi:MAG: TonB-dependent receptor, partial [Acidobacteria bacterium]
MKVSVAMFLVLCISGVNVWAQTVSVAQITGTVKDRSGALVRGAEVKVIQTDTGYTRSCVTDDEGAYTLPSLPIGRYRLEVSMPGFGKYVQTGIVLQVNSNPAIHVTLDIGELRQQVEVNANATMVESHTNSVGQVIDHRRIEQLPLNGRQVTQLILLSGVAVQSPVGAGVIAARNYPTSIAVSIAGGTANGTNFLLDGGFHNDANTNVSLPFPFPDAVQEFNVETNALSARYGLHAGGVVNTITKSGSNKLHGDVFEFVRNDAFNATNPFAARGANGKRLTDGLKRNQFGGTLGGPIVANKLFFFVG